MKLADFEGMVFADLRRALKMLRMVTEGRANPTMGARQIKSIASFIAEVSEQAITEGINLEGYTPRPKIERKRRQQALPPVDNTPGKPPQHKK